jgi:hypothetical protein
MTRRLIVAGTLIGLSVGALLYLSGARAAGSDVWAGATVVVLVPLVWSVVRVCDLLANAAGDVRAAVTAARARFA